MIAAAAPQRRPGGGGQRRGGALPSGDTGARREQVSGWLEVLAGIARRLAPYLPDTSRAVLARLSARPLQPGAPLFPRAGRGAVEQRKGLP